MKLAICYSGAIRSLPETIENNLNFFKDFDIDLYFYTWDHVGYSPRINSPDYIMGKRTLNCQINQEVISGIVKRKIKNIRVEKYIPSQYTFELFNGLDNIGLIAQYYKLRDCYNLIDKNIKYDGIVRIRCDILLRNKINFYDIEHCIKNNKIIVPNNIWYNHLKNSSNIDINEMIWISNPYQMNKLCNIYNNSSKINKLIREKKFQETNYGERISGLNFEAEGLNNSLYLHDFDYQIIR